MDDFLCFDESLFEREANDERPRYPAFLPNIVGDLKFLHENDEESLKASSDWFYLLNEYDRCSECLLKLWGIDSIQASDGYPKRIITEAIVRCFLKLNKKQDLSFFLKHHCQLSITQEDYIGHLMIRLMPQAYESKRDRIELLQRLLLAVPPSFFDGDSSLVNNTNSSSTQFQLWVDLSSLWSSIEIDDAVQKQFYPVWFTQIALLYAEILNIPTKGINSSIKWVDESLTQEQINTCRKLALHILTKYCNSSNKSSSVVMSNVDSINIPEDGDKYELPFMPKQKCCSTDTLETGGSDEVRSVFFEVFVAPFVNIYKE